MTERLPSRSDPGRGRGPGDEQVSLDRASHRDPGAPSPALGPLPPDSANVEITESSNAAHGLAVRALLAALIAGLGALSSGVVGADAITLAVALTSLAAAAAAAGAVYGVRPEQPLETRMSRHDLERMRVSRTDQGNGGDR